MPTQEEVLKGSERRRFDQLVGTSSLPTKLPHHSRPLTLATSGMQVQAEEQDVEQAEEVAEVGGVVGVSRMRKGTLFMVWRVLHLVAVRRSKILS